MRKFGLMALALPVFLVGCGGESPENAERMADVDDEVMVPLDGGRDDVSIVEFTLSDGTRCVIADGHNSGGVTCDWN